MAEKKTDKAAGKAFHRSPAYPSIDLGHAIEFASRFFDHAKRTVVPAQNVAGYWGFSSSSSGWRLALAALKQFGLLESPGSKRSGEVKLTELALKIILDTRQSSPDRDEAIREAALAPEIYQEVWTHWSGQTPDDDTLATYLTLHKGFNESAVPGFISDLKETIAYAKLNEADMVRAAGAAERAAEGDAHEVVGNAVGSQERRLRRRAMHAGIKEDVFTLEEGQVVLQWPEKLSQESFEDFESWLQLVIRKAKRSIQKDEQERKET